MLYPHERIIRETERVSQPFIIQMGEQVTITAYGLEGLDQVLVEIVTQTLAGPIKGPCKPIDVAKMKVVSTEVLRCRNGQRIALCKEHPYVVLQSPQDVFLRVRTIPFEEQGLPIPEVNSTTDCGISVYKFNSEASGCSECPCEEPYDASWPVNGGGFGFQPSDIRDPEANVLIDSCDGTAPTFYIFPTPRPNATVAVYDCEGGIIGYARNSSHAVIDGMSVGGCNGCGC